MRKIARRTASLACLVALLPGGIAAGQPMESELAASAVTFRLIDNEARSHFARAEALLASGRGDEAIERLRRVMDGAKGLVRLEAGERASGFFRYVPVRHYCQMRLSRLAPEVLEIYRRQVDSLVQRWYEQAVEENDERLLGNIVDRYFCSSHGDDALFLLAEFALQRGHYATARGHWERIHPAVRLSAGRQESLSWLSGFPPWRLFAGTDLDRHWPVLRPFLGGEAVPSSWLAYPDSEFDPAAVRARLVLLSVLEGNPERARFQLDLMRRLDAGATGQIAGRRGEFVELLSEMLAESETWPVPQGDDGWPTLGGDVDRGRIIASGIEVGDGPIWEVPLARQKWVNPLGVADRLRVGEDAEGLLSYFPVVEGDHVLVGTDAPEVDLRGIHLRTGAVEFPGARDPFRVETYDNRDRAVPRFSLSVSGNVLYARVATRQPGATGGAARRLDRLVGVDITAQRKLVLDIRLETPEWEGDWIFAGPPVCQQGVLYVALRRLDDVRAEEHVAGFDARDGSLLWRQFICSSESLGERSASAVPNQHLSFAEDRLFYNTNAGAVAALDAEQGRILWVMRYPRVDPRQSGPDRNDQHWFRDLNPCLVENDLIVVAPRDCARIFGLDFASGKLLWATRPEMAADAIHLLGIAEGTLFASGDRLYSIDACRGVVTSRYPNAGNSSEGLARPSPRGYGRGFLAGHHVYWPTRESIFVFDQRMASTLSGPGLEVVRRIDLLPRGASGGNLLLVDGILLVASSDRLYAFEEFGSRRNAEQRRRQSD